MSYRYSDYDKISGAAPSAGTLHACSLPCASSASASGYIGNQVSFLPWKTSRCSSPAGLPVPDRTCRLFPAPQSVVVVLALCPGGGAPILLSKLDVLPMRKALVVVPGALLILIGLRILLNPLFRRWKMHRMYRRMENGRTAPSRKSVCLPGTEQTTRFALAVDLRYGRKELLPALRWKSLGEMTFDLREALVQDNSVIDANCSFGQLTILLPAGVRAEIAPRLLLRRL